MKWSDAGESNRRNSSNCFVVSLMLVRKATQRSHPPTAAIYATVLCKASDTRECDRMGKCYHWFVTPCRNLKCLSTILLYTIPEKHANQWAKSRLIPSPEELRNFFRNFHADLLQHEVRTKVTKRCRAWQIAEGAERSRGCLWFVP